MKFVVPILMIVAFGVISSEAGSKAIVSTMSTDDCVSTTASGASSGIVVDVNDLREITQATINVRALDKYFHVAKARRKQPLIVLKNQCVQSEPALTKFGVPVQYALPEVIKRRSLRYFVFTKIEINDTRALVEFRYPREGIAGETSLVKRESGWIVESHKLFER